MVDFQLIVGKVPSSEDIEGMNLAEARSRKYKYCTIDAVENGTFLAMVEFSESTKSWEPFKVQYEGDWISIDAFDNTEAGESYSCEDYRAAE